MSATARITVLERPSPRPGWSRPPAPDPGGRDAAGAGVGRASLVRLVAFGLLGLYGVLRWGTMLRPVPLRRLLELLLCALVIAGPVSRIRVWSRPLAVLAAVATTVAALAFSGIPPTWIEHLRIAVTARDVGDALAALPQVLVPYAGLDDSVRTVILLGAAVLLVGGALMLALAPAAIGEARLAAVALPLLVLAAVPSALIRPQLPYLHGALIFGLVALLLWGERVASAGRWAAIAILVPALVGAVALASAVDSHRSWLNVRDLAGGPAAGHSESFDWTQSYGPLRWPRTGREVLDVKAGSADYWKAEDLDTFDGRGWVNGPIAEQSADPLFGVARSSISRWTQRLRVSIRGLRTTEVIAAGTAASPQGLAGVVLPGSSPGTWLSADQLVPGASYTVSAYTPHPSPLELAAARYGARPERGGPSRGTLGSAGAVVPGELSITLPAVSVPLPKGPSTIEALPLAFVQYGLRGPAVYASRMTPTQAVAELAASPYGRIYALARRLRRGTSNPYSYLLAVERYLGHGFVYDESPPLSALPLVSFLLDSHRGYCQQFAGAMALLLRMGGVPARVAAGFATGSYDSGRHQFVVGDRDAHAWVEAWFPGYGWVHFDPTPALAPARGGSGVLSPATPLPPGISAARRPVRRPEPTASATRKPGARVRHRGRGAAVGLYSLVGSLIVLLLSWWAIGIRRRGRERDPGHERELTELERAFRRCGRPLGGGTTLASLERRFGASPVAAAYVRAVRLMRYSPSGRAPTAAQRRALRAELGAGLGPVGWLRAWWALPPQPGRGDLRSRGAGARRPSVSVPPKMGNRDG
ncbi:MAG: transglutaminase family protein [Solirubrobacteraceae bacterium]